MFARVGFRTTVRLAVIGLLVVIAAAFMPASRATCIILEGEDEEYHFAHC